MASNEAKTKPGSEATKALGSVLKPSSSHKEKFTESPLSKLRQVGMRHVIKMAVTVLQKE